MTQEKQTYKTIEIQIQQEIQYYVYQDLANVLGILADTQESLKHFKDQPNHPYIPMALNRLILQVNLSNGIMFDQQLTHQVNEDHKAFFESAKEEAKEFFGELIQKYKLDTNNEQINKCVSHYLEKNLAKETKFESLQPQKQVKSGEFNQKVVQQIFNGMSQVDQTMNQIAEGQYEKLTKEVILEQTINRAKRARLLLKNNFPNGPEMDQEQQAPLTQEPLTQEPQAPLTQEQQAPLTREPEAPPKIDESSDIPEDEATNLPQENKQPILKEQLNESEKQQEETMEIEPQNNLEEKQEPIIEVEKENNLENGVK